MRNKMLILQKGLHYILVPNQTFNDSTQIGHRPLQKWNLANMLLTKTSFILFHKIFKSVFISFPHTISKFLIRQRSPLATYVSARRGVRPLTNVVGRSVQPRPHITVYMSQDCVPSAYYVLPGEYSELYCERVLFCWFIVSYSLISVCFSKFLLLVRNK